MNDDVDERQEKVTTPFEDSMLESFVATLTAAEMQQGLVEHLELAFRAEKSPSADMLLQVFKDHSGEGTI